MVVKFGLVLRRSTDIVSQRAFREQVSILILFDPVLYSGSTPSGKPNLLCRDGNTFRIMLVLTWWT